RRPSSVNYYTKGFFSSARETRRRSKRVFSRNEQRQRLGRQDLNGISPYILYTRNSLLERRDPSEVKHSQLIFSIQYPQIQQVSERKERSKTYKLNFCTATASHGKAR